MKRKLLLIETYASFLFWDIMAWLICGDSWTELRRQSKTIYKLIKITSK